MCPAQLTEKHAYKLSQHVNPVRVAPPASPSQSGEIPAVGIIGNNWLNMLLNRFMLSPPLDFGFRKNFHTKSGLNLALVWQNWTVT